MKAFLKCLWLLAFCGGIATRAPALSVAVDIDGSQTNQIIEGFGANLNYSGWTNTDLEPVLDALIDQGGMTQFRVVFDNSDWEGTNDNGDSNVMNWDYYNTIYSSPRFQQLWGLMGYLNQKGITNGILLNFQGSGPDWMGGYNLSPGYEDEWAEMIASLLYYARNTMNLQFNLVAPDNEPNNSPQGIGVTDADQYITMLHALALKLDTNGMSDMRIVAPELAFVDPTFREAMVADPVVMAKLGHFGLHSYSGAGADSADLYEFIQQSAYSNLTMWVTEFNVNCPECLEGQPGTYDWSYCSGTASYLLAHLANGASAGMVWDGYDGVYSIPGPPWSFWGLFAMDDTNAVHKTYTARKNFYTMSQISKFVAPGAYEIGLNGNTSPIGQLLAFYNPTNGQFTITGINTYGAPVELSGSLASLPPIASLELYYTDDTSNMVDIGSIPMTGGTDFDLAVPADCVFTLTGFVIPPPTLQAAAVTNGITLSWSGSVTNFLLESTTDQFPPFTWSTITNTPQPVGDRQQVTVIPTNQQQFFRLRSQ